MSRKEVFKLTREEILVLRDWLIENEEKVIALNADGESGPRGQDEWNYENSKRWVEEFIAKSLHCKEGEFSLPQKGLPRVKGVVFFEPDNLTGIYLPHGAPVRMSDG